MGFEFAKKSAEIRAENNREMMGRSDREDNEEFDTEEDPPRRRYRHRRHSCRKSCGCLLLAVAVVILIAFLTVKYIVGPVVEKVDALPADFPRGFAIYQLSQAEIKVQTPAGKERVLKIIDALPDWALAPLLNYLSVDWQTQFNNTYNGLALKDNFTVGNLKSALSDFNLKDNKTVSLSWDNLDKTKEELADYYQQKLQTENFKVQKSLQDYEINLSFWQTGIDGVIYLTDSFLQADNSLMKMTVNYWGE